MVCRMVFVLLCADVGNKLGAQPPRYLAFAQFDRPPTQFPSIRSARLDSAFAAAEQDSASGMSGFLPRQLEESDDVKSAINDSCHDFCQPVEDCWPSEETWAALASRLSGGSSHLYKVADVDAYTSDCFADEATLVRDRNVSRLLSDGGNGVCMQFHDCAKEFCNESASTWDLPEYTVKVLIAADVTAALSFANKHNIAVTIKTSGHSYSGSSTARGSLLIWMRHFEKYGTITDFTDSCAGDNEMTSVKALKMGGGQSWMEAFEAVGSDYDVVGGYEPSLGAAGGWLMGGGLSTLARKHGLGVDNVLQFEVVLADGNFATADRCSNSDLFWALRGGGGGSFGVVTAVQYRLHDVAPITTVQLYINWRKLCPSWPCELWSLAETIIYEYATWMLLDAIPNLDDRRWNGVFDAISIKPLYFSGTMEEAEQSSFLKDLRAWKDGLDGNGGDYLILEVDTVQSYANAQKMQGLEYAPIPAEAHHPKRYGEPIASKLIPRDWVLDYPDEAMEFISYILINGVQNLFYLMGGAMSDVATDSTAVNPGMRHAAYMMCTFEPRHSETMRRIIPNIGVGYNHAFRMEPDWENAFWGSNLDRLKAVKSKFDPDYRFNCWHCLGYKRPCAAGEASPATDIDDNNDDKAPSEYLTCGEVRTLFQDAGCCGVPDRVITTLVRPGR